MMAKNREVVIIKRGISKKTPKILTCEVSSQKKTRLLNTDVIPIKNRNPAA